MPIDNYDLILPFVIYIPPNDIDIHKDSPTNLYIPDKAQ